jgi:hypothetical protein
MPPKRNSASSGDSATGRKSATVQAKHATQAPTIQKRPRRPRAAAAVRGATHRPTTRDPSPSPPHTSVSGPDRIEALEIENASLKLSVDAVSGSLDEVKEMLQALATNFKDGLAPGQSAILGTASAMPAYVGSMSGPQSFIGMTPEKTIQTLLPWVDATTLANVVACTLDVAHFVKLIPLEQRPKGQPTVGLAAGILFDIATMKHTVLNESTAASEKVFPDLQTLLNALSTYLVIRDLYDVDHVGFGSAIGLYIRQLAWWSKHHNWPAIVSYFVAHFRKHQSSNDPSDWYNVDIQLFTAHMTHNTLGKSVIAKDRASDQSLSTCRNWNDGDKGCVWKKCIRKHVCLKCAGDHPAFKCTKVSKSG